MIQLNLQRGPSRAVFGAPGVVTLNEEGKSGVWAVFISYQKYVDNSRGLRVRLCADEIVIITIDPRTGRLNLRDTGDLAAAGRGPRFFAVSEKINETPSMLMDALVRLRLQVSGWITSCKMLTLTSLQTIVDLAEQMAKYLGLQSFRTRNFPAEGRLWRDYIFDPSYDSFGCRETQTWAVSPGNTLHSTGALPRSLSCHRHYR